MNSVLAGVARGVKGLARPLFGTVTHVSTTENVAALTFDDGPNPQYTPRLLELLDRHGARATFFMVGNRVRAHPAIVERVAAAGHAIGNHSWDHPSFPFTPGRERRRQIRACQQALEPHGLRLFRAPGGHMTPRAMLDVRLLGFESVGWSCDPTDYAGRTGTEIADHVLGDLSGGAIILLHDALFDHPSADRSATIDAVEGILSAAGGRYEFVTVPELFRRGRRRRINWFWHPETDPFGASAAPPA